VATGSAGAAGQEKITIRPIWPARVSDKCAARECMMARGTYRPSARKKRDVEQLDHKIIPRLIALALLMIAGAVILAIFIPWIEEYFGR
jgi:hypothetical protein